MVGSMKIVGENNGGNDDGVGSTATTTTAVITTTGTREQSAYSAHAEFAQAGSEQGVKLIDWTTVRNGDSPCATPIVSRATSNETLNDDRQRRPSVNTIASTGQDSSAENLTLFPSDSSRLRGVAFAENVEVVRNPSLTHLHRESTLVDLSNITVPNSVVTLPKKEVDEKEKAKEPEIVEERDWDVDEEEAFLAINEFYKSQREEREKLIIKKSKRARVPKSSEKSSIEHLEADSLEGESLLGSHSGSTGGEESDLDDAEPEVPIFDFLSHRPENYIDDVKLHLIPFKPLTPKGIPRKPILWPCLVTLAVFYLWVYLLGGWLAWRVFAMYIAYAHKYHWTAIHQDLRVSRTTWAEYRTGLMSILIAYMVITYTIFRVCGRWWWRDCVIEVIVKGVGWILKKLSNQYEETISSSSSDIDPEKQTQGTNLSSPMAIKRYGGKYGRHWEDRKIRKWTNTVWKGMYAGFMWLPMSLMGCFLAILLMEDKCWFHVEFEGQ